MQEGKKLKRVTSSTQPITISWILNCGGGRLGLCFCPGKKVQRGSVVWERDMRMDLERLRDMHGTTTIVCLLDTYELRSFKISEYAKQVEGAGMKFGPHFPIVEMAAPPSVEALHQLVLQLVERMSAGETLAVHCRGGVGRAGTVACCVMLYLGLSPSAPEAIRKVRELRCKAAVESRRQEEFIALYASFLASTGADPCQLTATTMDPQGLRQALPSHLPPASLASAKRSAQTLT